MSEIDAYAIRHNLWATRRLLDHAKTLTPEQLELSVAGTAGSIRFCLAHIVGADQRYLAGLGVEPEEAWREAEDSDLENVAEIHAANERDWERLLREPAELDAWIERRGHLVHRVMFPAQAIHHGTDHRTQVGTILLHHGLELPDLDVWTYAESQGDLKPAE